MRQLRGRAGGVQVPDEELPAVDAPLDEVADPGVPAVPTTSSVLTVTALLAADVLS
jgi:hypothetical protein